MADSAAPRPMQRLVMITTILRAAGPAGRGALELAEAVGYGGKDEGKREQLARSIRDLQAVGVDVVNTAPLGDEARWVLRPGDSRIRLAFTPEQQAELARAALLADRDRLVRELGADVSAPTGIEIAAPRLPSDVDLVLRAVTARCVLRFSYNGRTRTLDPATMQRGSAGWAVSGRDRGAGEYRTFYLARMSAVEAGEPGSAAEVPAVQRGATDPLRWHVDPPLDVQVEVAHGHEGDVERLLGAPPRRAGQEWEYLVTNRWVFLARVAELGERIRLTGPEPIRREFAEMLHRVGT